MASGQPERFERWRRRLPKHSAYLVQLVLDEVLPLFEQAGYRRFSDYAGNRPDVISAGTMALQRRDGERWPTVEICFSGRTPLLSLYFALLPEQCYRNGLDGRYAIPRVEANVLEGDAAFRLRKGSGKSYEGNFGYNWLSLCPERRLRQEVGELKARIPWLLDILESGIPPAWLDQSSGMRVGKYAFAAFNSTARPPLPDVSQQPEAGNK